MWVGIAKFYKQAMYRQKAASNVNGNH